MHNFLCVCSPSISVHKGAAKYEGSTFNQVVRRATWRNKLKWLPFKKYMLYLLKSYAYTRDICACICKIQSFCDQTCGCEDCPQTMMPMTTMTQDATRRTIHDCIGSHRQPFMPTMSPYYDIFDPQYLGWTADFSWCNRHGSTSSLYSIANLLS